MTKCMHIKRTDQRNIPLHINNFSFKKVCNFTYLGSLLNESNLCNLKFLKEFAKETENTMQIQNF